MSDNECGTVREHIPDFVSSRLDADGRAAVDTHVARCDECAAELELAQFLYASRARPPEGFADRLVRAVVQDRRSWSRPSRTWWGATAAAVAALALGIGQSAGPADESPVRVPGYAYEVEEGEVWLSDDGLMAGAPVLDGLTDEALMELLDELSVSFAGGSL